MVKIAPDKSLPQTKNRGQRLTLTKAAHFAALNVASTVQTSIQVGTNQLILKQTGYSTN